MGKPKDDADRATEQIGFRVTKGEKAAVEEMAKRRRAETGDASTSGWFRALIRREAKAVGVTVDETDARGEAVSARSTKPKRSAARASR